MSQSETIARPYAKAAFEQAKENQRERWQVFLAVAGEILADETTIAHLKSPGFYPDLNCWLDEYLKKNRKEGLAQDERNFLQLLHDNHRLAILPEISQQFTQLINVNSGVCEAIVYTAQPLTDAQCQAITKKLSKETGQKVVLNVKEDACLLAGVRIEYNGLVIDQSAKGRIEQFARNLDDLRN